MNHRQVFRSLPRLLLVSLALGVGSNGAAAGPHGGGGHGAGAGHTPAFHGGHYGHGYHGYRGGYYGYPYGFYGFGWGFGLGYGYGYPYYGYPYSGGAYYGGGYYGNSYYDFGGGYPYPGSTAPNDGGGFPSYFPYSAAPPEPAPGDLPSARGTPPAPLPIGLDSSPTAPSGPDSEAALLVRVPTSATVWVNGVKTTQKGPRREFVSTGLKPGRNYTFLIRAQWVESSGRVVDHDRTVTVQAGERRAVDFGPAPDAVKAAPTPAPGTP